MDAMVFQDPGTRTESRYFAGKLQNFPQKTAGI